VAPDKPLLHNALLNCSVSYITPGRQAPCESARERSDQTAVSGSRHIKTNCGDDVNSYDYVVNRFKKYLQDREDWFIKIHGKNTLTGKQFTYKKTDVHRWKDGYLKKRLARLYKLRDWFLSQASQEVTMITLTVPHNINKWGKKVNIGHNIIQSWENLKQGWNRLRMCQVFKSRDFLIVYEPHPETGYPHAHLMVFTSFFDDEIKHIKELWHAMTGADLENGVNFNPGVGIKHVIAYLMKYMAKTLYHTIHEWTPEEWLFNAIAHEKRYRFFGVSNKLSKAMRLEKDSEDTVECLDVSLDGLKARYDDDAVCSARIWQNPQMKQNHPMLRHCDPIPTSVRVVAWKLKNNIIDSPSEIVFKVGQKAWKEWEKKRQSGMRN
jgi:hypothetical protein